MEDSMNRKSKLVFLVALMGLTLSAGARCVRTITDFTIVSTKNIDMSRAGEFKRSQRVCRGRDVVHWVTIFPLSFTGEPDMKPAIDRAIQSVPGCVALVDGRIREVFWYIPFIYGQNAIIAEGTPLVDPNIFGK
jgi:hypothetical protein